MFSFITFAGDPPTRLCGGTSFVTVALAATTLPSPTVTPGMMVQPEQSQTWSPICLSLIHISEPTRP